MFDSNNWGEADSVLGDGGYRISGRAALDSGCESAAMGWMIGVVANLTIGLVAYALAWQIARNLLRDRQWPTNRLALDMLPIVGTCATGHLQHGFHLLTSPSARL